MGDGKREGRTMRVETVGNAGRVMGREVGKLRESEMGGKVMGRVTMGVVGIPVKAGSPPDGAASVTTPGMVRAEGRPPEGAARPEGADRVTTPGMVSAAGSPPEGAASPLGAAVGRPPEGADRVATPGIVRAAGRPPAAGVELDTAARAAGVEVGMAEMMEATTAGVDEAAAALGRTALIMLPKLNWGKAVAAPERPRMKRLDRILVKESVGGRLEDERDEETRAGRKKKQTLGEERNERLHSHGTETSLLVIDVTAAITNWPCIWISSSV